MKIFKDIRASRSLVEKNYRAVRGKDGMAMIFQESRSALSPYYKVENQLYDVVRHLSNDLPASGFREVIDPVLEKMHFPDLNKILKSYPHELSGGESQRVLISMALIGRPRLIIADEPTTSLDAVIQHEIIGLLLDLIKEKRFTLIFITHDLALLQHLVQNVIVMFGGKIVETGDVKTIFDSGARKHPYTDELLRSAGLVRNTDETVNIHNHGLSADTGCVYAHRCLRKKAVCEKHTQKLVQVDPSGRHQIACEVILS